MAIVAILALGLLGSPQGSAATLDRVFKQGEKGSYKVLSNLQIETRGRGLETFMPDELDIAYGFTYEVTQMKPDGFAVLRYKRPTMTETEADMSATGSTKRTIKTNMDLSLTVSPINEIIDLKDLAPPKKKDGKVGRVGKVGKDGLDRMNLNMPTFAYLPASNSSEFQIGIDSFIEELHRLSLFIGSLDSAIDFSPKLPFDEVKPGDTWQKTVGYSPQKLKGKEGKLAVQRLDYTYTYKGIVQAGAKKVHRITASLKLDTDAAPFVNQMVGQSAEETHIKEIRLSLDASIDYDLDLTTRKTLKAVANSNGGFKIIVTDFPDEPVQEQRIRGRTTMRLIADK